MTVCVDLFFFAVDKLRYHSRRIESRFLRDRPAVVRMEVINGGLCATLFITSAEGYFEETERYAMRIGTGGRGGGEKRESVLASRSSTRK